MKCHVWMGCSCMSQGFLGACQRSIWVSLASWGRFWRVYWEFRHLRGSHFLVEVLKAQRLRWGPPLTFIWTYEESILLQTTIDDDDRNRKQRAKEERISKRCVHWVGVTHWHCPHTESNLRLAINIVLSSFLLYNVKICNNFEHLKSHHFIGRHVMTWTSTSMKV